MTDARTEQTKATFVTGVLLLTSTLTVVGSWHYFDQNAPFGNDSSSHLALAVHVSDILGSGQTDFFWGASNLGLPLYAAYQPLPSLVTGCLILLFGHLLGPVLIFKLVQVSLWTALPWCWYLGARWIGAQRWGALVLALATLAPVDWLSVGMGLTAVAHTGLVTQLWGLCLFPLALGALERCVVKKNLPLMPTAMLLALSALCHLFIGLLIGLVALSRLATEPTLLSREWRATAFVGLVAFGLCGFWLIPLLLTGDYRGGLPWDRPQYRGWSPLDLFRTFFSGQLLDSGRIPLLTICSSIGLAWTLKRAMNEAWARTLLIFGLLCVLLMGGTDFWGDSYRDIPLHRDVNPARYILGLHVVCITALSALVGSWSGWRNRRWATGIVLVLLTAYADDRRVFARDTWATFNHRGGPFEAVAVHLSKRPQHRFAVDHDLGTASHFHRDLLPMVSRRAQLQSYALGFHATHATYYAEYVRYHSDWMRLFNVGELVALNGGGPVADHFEVTFESGPYRVFGVPGAQDWGYFDVRGIASGLNGDLRALRPRVREITLDTFNRGYVIPLNTSRSGTPNQTNPRSLAPRTTAGRVEWSSHSLTSYHAQVFAAEGDWLLLKVNYFPFWKAWVSGVQTDVVHVAPNFMAVPLTPGRHQVTFRYQNPTLQKFAFGCSVSACVTWLFFVLRGRVRRWNGFEETEVK